MFRAAIGSAVVVLAALLSGPVKAQDKWPSKPITLIVPYPAGVLADISARIYARGLKDILGQPVVVDNRPGAGTVIAMRLAASAKPDGYTMIMAGATTIATRTLLNANIGFKVSDFDSVAITGFSNLIFSITADIPAKTVPEFVALAKASPGEYAYFSTGNGGLGHLTGALFTSKTGIDWLHVPYTNLNNATLDQVAGRVHAQISTIAQQASFIQSGKLRALAVTGTEREPMFPDVPTMKEAGVDGYDIRSVLGILVPKGTPADIIAKLNQAFNAVSAEPNAQRDLAGLGLTPQVAPPGELMRLIEHDIAKFEPVIRQFGIKADD
jgi:tripartite-type tricarboxylate transporter receptor subunit TctC